MNSDLVFFNQCFDKKRLKAVISWYCKNFGEEQALRMVEEFKKMGFNNATQAGISIGLSDLKTPGLKPFLVSEAEVVMSLTQQEFQGAQITCTEKSQRIIDTWHRASEILRKKIVDYFSSTDEFNPVYIMALSGARGNFSQVRQLVGMRGLMADPQGQIISFPIRSNFREGLTLTEYFISCSGARKGLVDTALRTADTGYLTRRLVDVSHHVVVKRVACETNRGIFMKPSTSPPEVVGGDSGNKMLLSLKQRLIGRVLAKDIVFVAKQDQEITPELASQIASLNKPILVRSPLTCSFNHDVCQLCYGWSPAQGNLVSLGEAVGVIAAQSIGEPGTQLTMRTFHTGGVFSGDLLEEIKSPCNGKVLFLQAFQGLLIRTAHGKIAFLTKVAGEMIVRPTDDTDFEALNEKQNLNTAQVLNSTSQGSTSKNSTLAQSSRNPVPVQNSTKVNSANLPTIFSSGGSSRNETRDTAQAAQGVALQNRNYESKDLQHVKPHLIDTYIPFQALTMVFVRHGEYVKRNQLVAEFSSLGKEGNQPIKSKQTLFADFSGQVVTVLGGNKKSSEELERIQPDKSGRLGFFFVLSASVGATLEQLRHNRQEIRLNKMQLLDTIAHPGDLVDSDYSKLPQSHSFPVLSQSTCIALDTDQSLIPGMWASSKSTSSLTKRSKTLELATDTRHRVLTRSGRNVFKQQPSFLGGKVKKRKVTHLPLSPAANTEGVRLLTFGDRQRRRQGEGFHQRWLAFKNKTGGLLRWNQAFTRVFNSQAQLSTKHTQRKEKTSVKQIPKTTENLYFSKLYQGCIENLFSLTSLTTLQGKSIPFFFNPCLASSPLVIASHQFWWKPPAITKGEEASTKTGGEGGWITMTDAFRLSSLHQQANKTLALREAEPIHILKASSSFTFGDRQRRTPTTSGGLVEAAVSYKNTRTQSEHANKTTLLHLRDSPQPGLNMKLESTLLQIQYKKNPHSTPLNQSTHVSPPLVGFSNPSPPPLVEGSALRAIDSRLFTLR
uniref:DNA-directed RNA polymerase n=1 Tax=Watanabea reniformis TaxID=191674 RepID=A0A097KK91_9CHLO|nr:beta'' subunit of RNA polymerase [Watanabea reniformis]AIT93606.1 beta'' subunit of RNA polymerase [Watanabea reniformis]